MVDVYLLKANEGDCLVIRYGNEEKKHNIIVDGGTATCGKTVKSIIERCNDKDEEIDLILITHVDKDHICGIIDGFANVDEKILQNSIRCIAFNTRKGFQHHNKLVLRPGIGPEETVKTAIFAGDGCSIKDAKSLLEIINDKGLCDKVKDYIIAGTEMNIGGAKLTILSPDEKSLARFMNDWEDDFEHQAAHGCSSGFPDVIYNDLSTLMNEYRLGTDGSLSNRASIAFIFEYEDKKTLFLGDAAAPVYVKELKKCFNSKKIAVDIVKLSHHGSSRNLSGDFLKIIDTEIFMISSNGTTLKGQYTVPGKVAIAKLLKGRKKVVLLNNYRWWETTYQNQYFTENDIRKYINTKVLELVDVSKNPYNVKQGLNVYGKFTTKKLIG